jgi:hypothetical protein
MFCFLYFSGCTSRDNSSLGIDWYKYPPPRPQVFLPNIVSSPRFEHGPLAVSPDMKELYWGSHFPDSLPLSRILYTCISESGWAEPQTAEFSLPYGSGEPFFAGPNSILFRSDRPIIDGGRSMRTYFITERSGGGWTTPVPLDPDLMGVSWQSSLSSNGTLYFVMDESAQPFSYGSDDLYRSVKNGAAYSSPENLGSTINTTRNDWGPCILPDESALIFSSDRRGGKGGSDLYISFRSEDGSWTPPRNLGRPINTWGNENWPSLSPDGKCLFFIRSRMGNGDVYWVDAGFIERLSR